MRMMRSRARSAAARAAREVARLSVLRILCVPLVHHRRWQKCHRTTRFVTRDHIPRCATGLRRGKRRKPTIQHHAHRRLVAGEAAARLWPQKGCCCSPLQTFPPLPKRFTLYTPAFLGPLDAQTKMMSAWAADGGSAERRAACAARACGAGAAPKV